MSWFSNSVSTVELDNKVSEATSEAIPNGELELSVGLEITDLIRSKKLPAKQCMRALKKRLTMVHSNPNLTMSTLKLIDLCVKNSGFHFLVEISSREFMDYLVDVVFKHHYNTKLHSEDASRVHVGNFILALVESWTKLFENQLQLNYVEKCYQGLRNEGFVFPANDYTEQPLNSKFVDSEVPPDWIDNDSCMICYNPFSMINRKHHCRACGGVFCQTHSSNSVPLVALGIRESSRVCDNCYLKYKPHSKSRSISKSIDVGEDDDEFRKAIELSLQESGIRPVQPPKPVQPVVASEEDDDEMKVAIAASLKEFEQQERFQREYGQNSAQQSSQQQNQQQIPQYNPPQVVPETQSDFYNNILPVDSYESPVQQLSQAHEQAQQKHAQNPFQSQIPPQPTAQEDLTQKEEEQINLFITLMNSVKNDPKKRANILYDSDLSELHAQIIRLKPKVNKSLRVSIEKYETFLELNNKISTITRLYDEFLEQKLSFAYGNHQVQDQGYFSSYDYNGYPAAPSSGPPQQNQQTKLAQQPQQGHLPPQYTSNIPPQLTHQFTNQQAQPQQQSQQLPSEPESPPAQYQTVPQQATGYSHSFNRTSTIPSIPRIPTGYPEPTTAQPAYPAYPSEPYADVNYEEPSEPVEDEDEELAPVSAGSYPPSAPPLSHGRSASYPQTYPEEPVDEHPTYPTSFSPTGASLDLSNQATPKQLRRSSTTMSADAVEHASERFPPISNFEDEAEELQKLPSMPRMPSLEGKFVAEPEPLIEL